MSAIDSMLQLARGEEQRKKDELESLRRRVLDLEAQCAAMRATFVFAHERLKKLHPGLNMVDRELYERISKAAIFEDVGSDIIARLSRVEADSAAMRAALEKRDLTNAALSSSVGSDLLAFARAAKEALEHVREAQGSEVDPDLVDAVVRPALALAQKARLQ